MASNIERAVAQTQMGGSQPLHGSTPTTQFQASAQKADVGDNGFGDAMARFVKAGTGAYGTYADQKAKNAQAESDKIIRSMTLSQRREAIGTGTLHMQDDPDTMNILRHDTGRTAAYDVENEMQTKISNGEFDQQDRKQLEEYRQQRLEMVSQSYAKEAGIDPTDPDYQRGFNSDIVRRNAGLFDLHEQRRSKRFIAQTVINTRGDVGGLLTDPGFMKGTDAGAHMANYFNTKYASGGIPTDQAMIEAVNQTVSDATERDYGTNFLKTFGDQEITVMGVKQKARDIIGEDKYQNLIAQSGQKAYQRNRPKFEKFQTDLATAENLLDPVAAANAIDKVDTENQWIQDSDVMTPQKQAIINARIAVQNKLKEHTKATAKATEELIQSDNRISILDQQYTRKMSGESVDLTKIGQVEDSVSGKWKDSDWANFADYKLKQIDAMGISQEQKDSMKGKLISTDHANGPFRRQFQTLIDDANTEWRGAVATGEAGDMKRINELQRVYAQQPSLIAGLFPDQAGFIEKMQQMKASGIDPRVLMEADKKKAGLSKEELINRDVQWAAVKKDSSSPALSALPDNMEVMARSLYDAFLSGTGDANDASKQTSAWLEKNTVSFSNNSSTFGVGGDKDYSVQQGYQGMLNKKDLMADPNEANSWESGQKIVKDTIEGIKAASPYWAESPVRVETNRAGAITISNFSGQQVVITQESLQKIHQARQAAAREQQMADKVANEKKKDELWKQNQRGGGYDPTLNQKIRGQ